jgi:hypothetical protein
MGDVLKKAAKVVYWSLACVGVFFAGRDLWRWAVPSEPQAEVAQAVESAPCLCSAGAECTGPKGGVYCLTDDGKKKYKGRP